MFSAVRFAQWLVCFKNKSFIADIEQKPPFSFDEHNFIIIDAFGHYKGFALYQSTSFKSFATNGFQFVKTSAGREDFNYIVRYEPFGFVKFSLPAPVNVIDNVERLPVGEPLFYLPTDGCRAEKHSSPPGSYMPPLKAR